MSLSNDYLIRLLYTQIVEHADVLAVIDHDWLGEIPQRPLVRINRYQPDIGVWRLEEIGLEICERYPLAVTQRKTLPKCVGEVNPRADEVNG